MQDFRNAQRERKLTEFLEGNSQKGESSWGDLWVKNTRGGGLSSRGAKRRGTPSGHYRKGGTKRTGEHREMRDKGVAGGEFS